MGGRSRAAAACLSRARRHAGRSGGVLRCLILRVEGRTRWGLRDHLEATGVTPVLDPQAVGRVASLAYAAEAGSMANMVLFPLVGLCLEMSDESRGSGVHPGPPRRGNRWRVEDR